MVMMWCLQPFGWQAFAISEKRFFILDSAKGLYSPSAYFVAYVLSSALLASRLLPDVIPLSACPVTIEAFRPLFML